MQRKDRFGIRKMTLLAVFTALAYAVTFTFRINVSFLTFDAKDAIVGIAAMIFGPASGAIISFLVATIEQITVGDTGFWGWLMDFASTATFSIVAGYIYSKRRNISGVAISLSSAVVSTVTVMMLCNLLITPIYMKVELAQVIDLIPTLLFPFNLTKAVLNAGVVLALYKPLITALRAARLLPKSENSVGTKQSFWSVRSLVFILVAIVLISASIIYMIFGLGGHFAE
ncbi:MAG: ECF transporter S component [Clostridia bacterium]|nr:ECF transporter S component [Clostridia bacterium]